MAWTTPRTWTVGEVVTAAELNEQIRDNVGYLYDRAVTGIVNSGGTIIGGSRYTVSHTGTGAYTVSFGTAFPVPPAVIPAVTWAEAGDWVAVGTVAAGSFTVKTGVTTNPQDLGFQFIAHGIV